MGMIFTLDDDGDHVSTGKYPYVAGMVHVPDWGPWMSDTGMWMRQCKFRGCDLDDWSGTKPECDAAGCKQLWQTTFTALQDGELGGRHWQTGDALHYCWPHARKIYNDKDPLDD